MTRPMVCSLAAALVVACGGSGWDSPPANESAAATVDAGTDAAPGVGGSVAAGGAVNVGSTTQPVLATGGNVGTGGASVVVDSGLGLANDSASAAGGSVMVDGGSRVDGAAGGSSNAGGAPGVGGELAAGGASTGGSTTTALGGHFGVGGSSAGGSRAAGGSAGQPVVDAGPDRIAPKAWPEQCREITSLAELKTNMDDSWICVNLTYGNWSGVVLCPNPSSQERVRYCKGEYRGCPVYGLDCEATVCPSYAFGGC